MFRRWIGLTGNLTLPPTRQWIVIGSERLGDSVLVGSYALNHVPAPVMLPWYASPIFAAMIGIAGVVVGVIGCLLTIWTARAARNRRRLIYTVEPHWLELWRLRWLSGASVLWHLLFSQFKDDDDDEDEDDRWWDGPAEFTLTVRCKGPSDIRPTDFVNDQPLVINVGGKIESLTTTWTDKQLAAEERSSLRSQYLGELYVGLEEVPATFEASRVTVAPHLIRSGSLFMLSGIAYLESKPSHRGSIADVRVAYRPPRNAWWHWRRPLKWLTNLIVLVLADLVSAGVVRAKMDIDNDHPSAWRD